MCKIADETLEREKNIPVPVRFSVGNMSFAVPVYVGFAMRGTILKKIGFKY
jgi:hypothetical protein